MSIYTFAAANLTTPADLRRRPAIDRGQLARTLVLFAVVVIALSLSIYGSRAIPDSVHGVEGAAASS